MISGVSSYGLVYKPQLEKVSSSIASPRRLLIVKVHGMGDSVLIRAIIERIQRVHPEVEIGVLVGSATRELMTSGLNLRVHTYDQRHLTPARVVATWHAIRRAGYDTIANFEQGSLAGTAFLASVGICTRLGFIGPDGPKQYLLSHGITFQPLSSMWDSFLELGRRLYPDLPDDLPTIELNSSPSGVQWMRDWWLRVVGEPECAAVAMHLGCGRDMQFKQWPLDRFLDLANRLAIRWPNLKVLLTGTSLEGRLISEFRKRFRGTAVDASNLGSIEKTALILGRCRLLISNDTGVAHLAAAIGTPTVGLFGPTSSVHWAPLGSHATYVYDTKLPCSPCVNNHLNLMPSECTNAMKGQCMRDIEVSSVLSAIDRVIYPDTRISMRAPG
jgi:ADP-heptose:LPS heptosyltransferase